MCCASLLSRARIERIVEYLGGQASSGLTKACTHLGILLSDGWMDEILKMKNCLERLTRGRDFFSSGMVYLSVAV